MDSYSKISPVLQPLFSHKITSPTDLEVFNTVKGMAVSFDLIKGEHPKIDISGCGGGMVTSVWHTESRTGFLTIPKTFTDVFTVRFIVEGSFIRRNTFGEHYGNAGYALLVPFEGMLNEEASPSFKAINGTITRKLLFECHCALYGPDIPFPKLEIVADMRHQSVKSLFHTFRTINNRVHSAGISVDMLLPLLEEIAGYQLLSGWPQSTSRPRVAKPSARLVRLATEYIEANLPQQFKLADVASATGVSVRSLQTSFKHTTGRTPIEYVIDRRLDQVEVDLLRSDRQESIRTIAARWGFSHMGDFARRYRLRFGESPRETRQRAKS